MRRESMTDEELSARFDAIQRSIDNQDRDGALREIGLMISKERLDGLLAEYQGTKAFVSSTEEMIRTHEIKRDEVPIQVGRMATRVQSLLVELERRIAAVRGVPTPDTPAPDTSTPNPLTPNPLARSSADEVVAVQTSAAKSAVKSVPGSTRPSQEPLLVELQGLTRHFGDYQMPSVTLRVPFGAIVAVVGANGIGKTTFLRMVVGDLLPTAGQRKVHHLDRNNRPVRTPIVWVSQNPEPWRGTVESHLQHYAALHGCPAEENRRQVDEAIEGLDLHTYRRHVWNALPAGIRMRVALAAAVTTNPLLFVLDEPMAPLDPVARQRFLSWLQMQVRGGQCSAILSSLHIEEVERIANQLVVFDREESLVFSQGQSIDEGGAPLFALWADNTDGLRRELETSLWVRRFTILAGIALVETTTDIANISVLLSKCSGVRLCAVESLHATARGRMLRRLFTLGEDGARDLMQEKQERGWVP